MNFIQCEIRSEEETKDKSESKFIKAKKSFELSGFKKQLIMSNAIVKKEVLFCVVAIFCDKCLILNSKSEIER